MSVCYYLIVKKKAILPRDALLRTRLGSCESFSQTREIPFGKQLNCGNYLSKCLPFFSEVVLDARRNFEESPALHHPKLLQSPQPLGERFGANMSHVGLQFVKAFGTT